MKIIYAGNNQRGIKCLETLASSDNHHVVAYAIASKGEEGWFSSIKPKADELRIPCSIENNPNDDGLLNILENYNPDLIVMCGYSKLVHKRFREISKHGCINLHASKLPDYRGAAPLNWALINGEKEIGLSIYQVDSGVDTGDLLKQIKFAINSETTIEDVLNKTLKLYPEMLLEVCDQIENGTTKPKKQDPNEGRYFTRRFPKDGEINWDSMTDMEIHNLVRALTHPYPGAFFNHQDEKIYVWGTKLEEKNYHGIPGRIAARHKDGVIVITKNRGIKLTRIQESHRELDARDFFTKTAVDLK